MKVRICINCKYNNKSFLDHPCSDCLKNIRKYPKWKPKKTAMTYKALRRKSDKQWKNLTDMKTFDIISKLELPAPYQEGGGL